MTYRIKYTIILFAAASLTVGSCKKSIDLQPEFQLDGTNPLSSIDQVEQALTGVYSGFRSGNYYSDNSNLSSAYSLLPDMMSDNLVETGESLANFRQLVDWLYASDNGTVNSIWNTAYNIISRTNIVLRDVDQFAAVDQKRVNRIKGQALAIRAHVHFDIMRYWGTSFNRNNTSPDSLGIPYVKTFDVTNKPTRLTTKATYDELYADLTQAAQLLADVDKPINTTSRARIDLATVHAIRARVSLYAGEWADAITASSAAIAARPLAYQAAFAGIWTDVSNTGVLWSVQFDAGQGGPGGNVFFAQGNRNSFRPSPELVAMYDATLDIRHSAYFQNFAAPSGGSRLIVRKYVGRTTRDGNVNFKVYRTGEMYLIRAEAYARSGQPALAMDDLNTLRRNRITGYTNESLTGAALLTAIEVERRKELFAEGHRFFDLKRTTRTITRTTCGTGSGSLNTRCTLAPSSRSWSFPIPFNELRANPAINQNQGYN